MGLVPYPVPWLCGWVDRGEFGGLKEYILVGGDKSTEGALRAVAHVVGIPDVIIEPGLCVVPLESK